MSEGPGGSVSKDSGGGPPASRSLKESGIGYHALLGALLAMFLVLPPVQSAFGEAVVRSFYVAVLVGALFAVAASRRVLVLGIALAAVPIYHSYFPPEEAGTAAICGSLAAIGFFAIVIGSILVRIFKHRRVTWATISGAVCVYMLLGTGWSLLYDLLAQVDPTAFDGLGGAVGEARQSLLYYFSFVTLATLGYGDIVPVTPVTRSMATLEAVVGQLYLVVMIARFVALHGQSTPEGSASA